MDDLDRVFRHLVSTLNHTDPARLRAPFEVAELYQRIIPYRTAKLDLRFESIEDYEMAILRLLAGERGYVALQPPDVQEVLRAETEGVNPYPGVFREYAAATMTLNWRAVQGCLDQDTAYAPPEVRDATGASPPPVVDEPETEPREADTVVAPSNNADDAVTSAGRSETPQGSAGMVFESVESAGACPHCRNDLPAHRRVVFCPFCGRQLESRKCPRCGELLEDDWRFCLTCGLATQG